MTDRRSDNEMMKFIDSYRDATQAELTATRLCVWVIVWGLCVWGAVLMMHLG